MKKFVYLVIILPLVLFFLYFGKTFYYFFSVNKEARVETVSLLLDEGAISDEIYQLTAHYGEEKSKVHGWNDGLLKIVVKENIGTDPIFNTYTLVMVASNDGENWQELVRLKGLQCRYYFFNIANLYCIDGPMDIKIIYPDGRLQAFNSFKSSRGANENLIALVKQSGNLHMVWADERARYVNLFKFDNWLVGGSDMLAGPYLIIMGVIKLDTLDAREYVIQYGPDWPGLVYDNKVWRWLTITPDGKSLYPQPL